MAGAMPKNRFEMKRADYVFTGVGNCKGCDALIEWWKTTNGKKIPFDLPANAANEYEASVPHFATCPKRDEFRGKTAKAAPESREPKTESRQTELQLQQRSTHRQQAVEQMQRTGNARIVIALFDDEAFASYRTGISGEDLRHELITEANNIKKHLEAP